jgi:predicted nucleic acid-binding protein
VNLRLATIFDSSVLSAFAVVRRLDLLEARFAGRAHWTIEVYREIDDGIAETPSLSEILIAPWLSEPIRSFAVDEIQGVRMALGGRPRNRRHLGEAATIAAAAANRFVVAVDDYDATQFARSNSLGLATTTTPAILRGCVRSGLLTAEEAAGLIEDMIDIHRRRLPRVSAVDLR